LRGDLVISNPPDLKGILPVRSKIARNAGPEPAIAKKRVELRAPERRIVSDDSYVYQESSAFNDSGEFLPPLVFGMAAYQSAERNTSIVAEKGVGLSVYA
jgi:hypothetical protein